MLILFGAGVGASDCGSACSDPVAIGRWILGLSLIIFVLPLIATPGVRALLRRLWMLVNLLRPRPKGHLSFQSGRGLSRNQTP